VSGIEAPAELRRFASLHPEVEAVLQRCGRSTWDLLLIDVDGDWVRAVVPSEAAGQTLADRLGVRLHRGFEDARLARRMSRADPWSGSSGRRRAR